MITDVPVVGYKIPGSIVYDGPNWESLNVQDLDVGWHG